MSDQNTPSLLEPQSKGGEDAGKGFDFQDQYMVSQIPCWLEWDGFSSLLQEAIGDIEVKFFSPNYGENIELIEVKNYRLTPAVFWNEIDRFYSIDQGSPNTFRWFRLVAPEISDELSPLLNGLRRIRFPYTFYPENSGVIQNSLSTFTQLVSESKRPSEYAQFLFNRVLIDTGHGAVQDYGEALFRQNFGQNLPQYAHLPYHIVSSIYNALLRLVAPRNTPIERKSIEDCIRKFIPADLLQSHVPAKLFTAFQDDQSERKDLYLDWSRFSGGGTRIYPDSKEWNEGVVGQLLEVKKFILNHRNTRHIELTGSRRLSATIAIGSIFSATSGFTVTMEQRDSIWWRTNDHATSGDQVDLIIEYPQVTGDELLVCIGIRHDIRQAVQNYAQKFGGSHLPLLNISSSLAVENARQANSIVAQAKTAILQSLTVSQATQIHLFCAIPSFLALLLGHRLNATAPVQCYEYVSTDDYVPTCFLSP